MASSSTRKSRTSKGTGKKKTVSSRKVDARRQAQDMAMFREIGFIVFSIFMILLFCCNFGVIGPVGDSISAVLFGLFGFTAYLFPVLMFLGVAFAFANEGNPTATRKMIAGVVCFLMLGVVCDLLMKTGEPMPKYDLKALYSACAGSKAGGGVFAGSISFFLKSYIGTIGTVLVVILCTLVGVILMTERSLIDGVKNGGRRISERTREDAERRREYNQMKRDEYERKTREREDRRGEEKKLREEERRAREEEKRLKAEEAENEKILRMEKKVSGVMLDTSLKAREDEKRRDDMHEIMYSGEMPESSAPSTKDPDPFDKIQIRTAHQMEMKELTPQPEPAPVAPASVSRPEQTVPGDSVLHDRIRIHKEGVKEEPVRETADLRPKVSAPVETDPQKKQLAADMQAAEKKMPKKYMFPPLSRLQKGEGSVGDSTSELKETALRLQDTLRTFGVKVTITDISQGPSVTRYELQPEQGVKVSKIVGLADDIKLNLAATDIRIEAPIPGKAAIGIEVPNKENMTVALRDLLESKEFREFPSNLAFAVGKDIAGKTVVTDIAKMPHMLIAGATGSGKSVCINTLIMSILYKAHPDDVKLIMVDPKVVELSVYNGIPHLLIPVVTDPKKASAALHWAVSEMEDRYRKFADYNVRDLKGYNKKLESMRESGEVDVPNKLPQIVIIVDELADLMMVSPGEVEESICRLAQLARACGIHLIIATQRPSVDVITGLIKANMPSRVAFAVSSGVDSRTILDMVGAEKLLGKGDMLFYPQGYSKPARIQGAFVSDKEVSDVVDFLKNQMLGNTYASDIEEKIKNMDSTASGSAVSGGDDNNGRDEYFEQAARFIIDKDKASIGMLQRLLKIGFNRAARIMDQLCEYGVVGEEEGTKPRKVLMSMEQFEQLMEEIL